MATEVERAAREWARARSALIALPVNDPAALNAVRELGSAEDALARAVRASNLEAYASTPTGAP